MQLFNVLNNKYILNSQQLELRASEKQNISSLKQLSSFERTKLLHRECYIHQQKQNENVSPYGSYHYCISEMRKLQKRKYLSKQHIEQLLQIIQYNHIAFFKYLQPIMNIINQELRLSDMIYKERLPKEPYQANLDIQNIKHYSSNMSMYFNKGIFPFKELLVKLMVVLKAKIDYYIQTQSLNKNIDEKSMNDSPLPSTVSIIQSSSQGYYKQQFKSQSTKTPEQKDISTEQFSISKQQNNQKISVKMPQIESNKSKKLQKQKNKVKKHMTGQQKKLMLNELRENDTDKDYNYNLKCQIQQNILAIFPFIYNYFKIVKNSLLLWEELDNFRLEKYVFEPSSFINKKDAQVDRLYLRSSALYEYKKYLDNYQYSASSFNDYQFFDIKQFIEKYQSFNSNFKENKAYEVQFLQAVSTDCVSCIQTLYFQKKLSRERNQKVSFAVLNQSLEMGEKQAKNREFKDIVLGMMNKINGGVILFDCCDNFFNITVNGEKYSNKLIENKKQSIKALLTNQFPKLKIDEDYRMDEVRVREERSEDQQNFSYRFKEDYVVLRLCILKKNHLILYDGKGQQRKLQSGVKTTKVSSISSNKVANSSLSTKASSTASTGPSRLSKQLIGSLFLFKNHHNHALTQKQIEQQLLLRDYLTSSLNGNLQKCSQLIDYMAQQQVNAIKERIDSGEREIFNPEKNDIFKSLKMLYQELYGLKLNQGRREIYIKHWHNCLLPYVQIKYNSNEQMQNRLREEEKKHAERKKNKIAPPKMIQIQSEDTSRMDKLKQDRKNYPSWLLLVVSISEIESITAQLKKFFKAQTFIIQAPYQKQFNQSRNTLLIKYKFDFEQIIQAILSDQSQQRKYFRTLSKQNKLIPLVYIKMYPFVFAKFSKAQQLNDIKKLKAQLLEQLKKYQTKLSSQTKGQILWDNNQINLQVYAHQQNTQIYIRTINQPSNYGLLFIYYYFKCPKHVPKHQGTKCTFKEEKDFKSNKHLFEQITEKCLRLTKGKQ